MLHLTGTERMFSPGDLITSRRFYLEKVDGDRKKISKIVKLDKMEVIT